MFLKDFCVRGRIISARIIHTYPHWGERNTHRRSLRIAVLSRQLKRRELRTWLSSCASQWSSLLALSRNVCAAWRQSAACTPLFDCSLASLSPIHSPCLGGHYFIPISVLLSPFLMCLRCSFLPLTVVSAGCCLQQHGSWSCHTQQCQCFSVAKLGEGATTWAQPGPGLCPGCRPRGHWLT